MTLLSIRDLRTYFYTEDGVVRAVNGINLDLEEGETLGIIGETGCGKTMLGLSILRLLSENTKVEGQVFYRGTDLVRLSKAQMRKIRGKEISMIFQNSLSSMNPVLTVGTQLAEPVEMHQHMKRQAAKRRVIEMLKAVKIPSPSERAAEYPHEFSGGMRQRAMIAMGLACTPSLIIADEPTTGLDVTIQAQIIELMKEVLEHSGASMLLITHDLGVASELCNSIAVMYAGEIIEYAGVIDLFKNPGHPYTRGFFDSLPNRGLKPMPGTCPSMINLPAGCKFHPRCPHASSRCEKEKPDMLKVGEKHYVRCFLHD